MNELLKYATTGLFTDYFDSKNIAYSFVGSYKLNQDRAFIFGPVKTIHCESGPFKNENIETGLGYLDKCKSGDILFVQGSKKFAYFGELMSLLCKKRGLQGAIIEGNTRDVRFTADHLPVFALGYTPVDIKGRGRVKSVGKEISVNGITIDENMHVAADKDGVIVFKSNLVSKIINNLIKEIKHEKKLKNIINKGKTVKKILEVTKGF